MHARIKTLKWILLLIISSCISMAIGPHLSFSLQKVLASSLAGISSILFGVLGIWVGVMAPNSLQQLYSSQDIEVKRNSWIELEFLLKPIFISLIVFAISTFFVFVGEILKTISFCAKNVGIIRSIGFFILFISVFLTLELIILSIRPGLEMLIQSSRIIKRMEKLNRITSNEGQNITK